MRRLFVALCAAFLLAATPASAAVSTVFGNATPNHPADNDTAAVQLGMKFTSSVAGRVTGVRFYKSAGNTGTHVGALWTAGGTRLASVTFTGETAAGWQSASFSSPVAISANTP